MNYLIERDSSDLQRPGRVFVTGPHFGSDIYSSTPERTEATRYDEATARHLASRKWLRFYPEVIADET